MKLYISVVAAFLMGLASPALARVGSSTSSITLSSTPTTVATANANRLWVRIINTGSNTALCGITAGLDYKSIASGKAAEWKKPALATKAFECKSASGTTVVLEGVSDDCDRVGNNCSQTVFTTLANPREYGFLAGVEINANATSIDRIIDVRASGNYGANAGASQFMLRTGGKIKSLHGECANSWGVGTVTFTLVKNACVPSTFCFSPTTLTCTISAGSTTCDDITHVTSFTNAEGIEMRMQTSSDFNGNTACGYAEELTKSDDSPYNSLVRWDNGGTPVPPSYGGIGAPKSDGTIAQAEMVMPSPGGTVAGVSFFQDNPENITGTPVIVKWTLRDETTNTDILSWNVDGLAIGDYRGVFTACTSNCFIAAGDLWDVLLTKTQGSNALTFSDRHVEVDFTGIGAIINSASSTAANNSWSSPVQFSWGLTSAPAGEFSTTPGGTLQNLYVVADGALSTTIRACTDSPANVTTCTSNLAVTLSSATTGNDTTHTITANKNAFFKNITSTSSTFIRAAAELVH